jgi:hypothetical protein
LYQYRATDV